MLTIKPNLPANLFLAPPLLPVSAQNQPLVLAPGQMVQALVIQGGLDRAVLEIQRQHYLAHGERELQVGQKLNLQVLQTQPRLELKVVNSFLPDRLARSLPMLARSFDWSQLIGQLQQQPGQAALPVATAEMYRQLQQILNPTVGAMVVGKAEVFLLSNQLRQLIAAVTGEPVKGQSLLAGQVQLPPGLQGSQLSVPFAVSSTLTFLFKNLQHQLSLLPQATGQVLPKNWHNETRKLLAVLSPNRELPHIPPSQRQLLVVLLRQIIQHPRVSPQLAGEVERILIQLDRQLAQEISLPANKGLVVGAKEAQLPLGQTSAVQAGTVAASQSDAAVQLQSATEIKQLLSQLLLQPGQKAGLAPELLGRLEGLLVRLQQLPRVSGAAPVLFPGFDAIMSQLLQLVSQPPNVPQGGQLGVLSQLFGFYLERELLQTKQKTALASLKLSLLGLQKELGEQVREPLNRLELFQLCRAKLGEEQVQFLPLPFNELEDGYLLAEKQSEVADDSAAVPLQMSLSLRLSALGNVRVDLLYGEEGLHLRLAGEDHGKMVYLQKTSSELKQSIRAVALCGISFSADAKLPARQLQERLFPESINILDTRV